eukprot:scaffold2974_cov181-Amphora_coffeaeformis.AAC.5
MYVLATYQRQKKDLACSWATRNPGGFTDDHIRVLERTKNVFFLVLGVFCKDIIAKTLLTVYLGADPGARVHEGSNARCAAVQFQQQLQDWSAEHIKNGDPGVEVGIGLHYGNCSYGNVGAPSRLDFTVIGPSVNLASRVEGLCSKLGASILASEPFVSRDTAFNEEKWKPRGAFDLKGINGEVDVYEHIASVNRAESAEHK